MNRKKAGYSEGIVSIVVNIALFIPKLWVGVATGSIALIADAWHTIADSISSIVVIAAVKLSSKKPDKEHPFGHGRWEQIAAMLIALLLAIIAYDFLKESILRLRHQSTVQFGTAAIIVTAISVFVKEALAQYAFYIGRKTKNLSIKADGWHHRTDALSSLVVLIGIFFAKYFWQTDGVLGIIVSGLLFYTIYGIVKEVIGKLLGEIPDQELILGIVETARKIYPQDLQPHHFHIHNYVTHQELTFHIRLDENLDIKTSHKIVTDIEVAIKNQYGIIATIHAEPLDFYHEED